MKKLFTLLALILIFKSGYASCPGDTARFSYSASSYISIQFYNISVGPSGSSCIWYFGDGSSSSISNPAHTYATSGSYTVKLFVTWASSGCLDSFEHTFYIPDDSISGNIYTSSGTSSTTNKVWLIKYDTATSIITAVDSTIVTGGNPVPFVFHFEAPGAYLVKTAIVGSATSGTGFVPTYHDTSVHWDSARLVNTTLSPVTNADIHMQTGTLTSGPGFIGGSVLLGAGKSSKSSGTIGSPVAGLLVYLYNASNKLIAYSTSDTGGKYSFSNLPVGNYYVYPENIGLKTTPWTGINLTPSAPSYTKINFTENSKTITPAPTAIQDINVDNQYIFVYPNPSNGNFYITNNTNETASCSILNITGQNVYQSNITQGKNTISLSKLPNGLYLIHIMTRETSYTKQISIVN